MSGDGILAGVFVYHVLASAASSSAGGFVFHVTAGLTALTLGVLLRWGLEAVAAWIRRRRRDAPT